jgi:putative transposase
VENDEQFWVVARYVERNALRAQLVLRAEDWRWSSSWRHVCGTVEEGSLLATWPIERPPDRVERINWTDDERELESLRQSVHRGRPFGWQQWQKPIAKRLGLESAYRPSGRPPKMGRLESGP